MEFKLQDLEKKRQCDPYKTPGMKYKIQKPYCTSTRHTLLYPRVSIVYYFKFRWSSSDKPYPTKNVIFHPQMTPGDKMKFQILTAYLQDMHQSYLKVSLIYF